MNAEARKFFADYFQMSKFSFKKSMAIKMRQVQSDQDGLKSIFETGFKRHSEPRLPSTAQINH
ncbi:hypothetical protein [Companilactobacillus paralimentarius]|uniref:hypothetical protein n=1 Tax=Companilactobacillus paralimentarius TaxID=83526 RepID=UPI002867DAED|nr:hypothetical protein [Companilactobacillus paralimentarius]